MDSLVSLQVGLSPKGLGAISAEVGFRTAFVVYVFMHLQVPAVVVGFIALIAFVLSLVFVQQQMPFQPVSGGQNFAA